MAQLREELREHVRVAHQMVAEYRDTDGTVHEAVTVDVSAGGAFFRTSCPPRPGMRLPITVWPDPRSETPVEALLEVRWTMDPGGRSTGGFGGRWLAAASSDGALMRTFLGSVLGIKRGMVAVSRDEASPTGSRFRYRFVTKAVAAAAPDAPMVEPQIESSDGDEPVYLAAGIHHGDVSVSGAVVGMTPDHLRVSVTRGLPPSFRRAQVRLLLDSSNGMLPIVFHGSVLFTRPQPGNPTAGEFVLKITKVDEYGRRGLYAQYLSYLANAA